MEKIAFRVQSIDCPFQYKEYSKNNSKIRKNVKQEETSQKEKTLNYLKTTTG